MKHNIPYRLVDLTHELHNLFPVYPGNQPTKLQKIKTFEKDGYNSYRLDINMHTGTHLDSPQHMIDTTTNIAKIPLSQCIGRGTVINVKGQKQIPLKPLYKRKISPKSIVLLYTGHARLFGTKNYYQDYPVLQEEWIDFLINKDIKILGMDSPSPDKSPYKVHHRIFPHNILLLENLKNLDQLLGIPYFEIMAFPLRIQAAASILRVVAKIPESA